jgi:hypothetical protein
VSDAGLPQELIDAANRMRDAVNLHVTVSPLLGERRPGFVAISLEDGRAHENTLYETRADAVRSTRNLSRGWFYAKVGADSMGEREAIIVLQQARQAFKAGIIFAEEEVVTPHLSELMKPFIPRTLGILGRN